MFGAGKWFMRSDDGQPHMAGWGLTAIKTEPTGSRFDTGWVGLAICPRCFALTFQDDNRVWRGNQMAHERWHAATDHPIPDDLWVDVSDSPSPSQEGRS
jgi:hypothetical protein